MDDPDEAVVNVINPDEDDEEVIDRLVDGGVLAATEDPPPATTKTLSKFSEAWRWRLCPEEEAGRGVLDVFRIPHVESR